MDWPKPNTDTGGELSTTFSGTHDFMRLTSVEQWGVCEFATVSVLGLGQDSGWQRWTWRSTVSSPTASGIRACPS